MAIFHQKEGNQLENRSNWIFLLEEWDNAIQGLAKPAETFLSLVDLRIDID